MKRREVITALAYLAPTAVLSVASKVKAADERTVFKVTLVEAVVDDPPVVVRVGSESWVPSAMRMNQF